MAVHESLKGNRMFDNKMVSLIKVAEETNQTEYIFEKLHQQYAIEVQQKSKMLSTIMEPLIIVVIGIFVGGDFGIHVFADVQTEHGFGRIKVWLILFSTICIRKGYFEYRKPTMFKKRPKRQPTINAFV